MGLITDPFFLFHILLYAVIILFEYAAVIKVLKTGTKRKSNCTRHLLVLICTNLVLGLVGLLPISFGLDSNLLLSSLKMNKRFCFLIALALLLALPYGLFRVVQYLPHIVLAALIASIAIISNKLVDLKLIWRKCPKNIAFVFLPICLSFVLEIFLSFLISLVVYLLVYIRFSECKTGYHVVMIEEFLMLNEEGKEEKELD